MLPFPFYFTALLTQIYNIHGLNTTIEVTAAETALTLNWQITNLSSAYAVSYSLSNFSDFNTYNVSNPSENQTELEYRIDNLQAGQQYFIRLLKDDAPIFSKYVNTRPLPPFNLYTTHVTTTTINMTWMPATDSIQDQYKVFMVGETEATFSYTSDFVSATFYNFESLKSGNSYKMSVVAYSGAEASNQSVPLFANTVPLAPASVTVGALDDNKLNVSWVPNPSSNQESYLISYTYTDSVTANEIVTNTSCRGEPEPHSCVLNMTTLHGQVYTVRVHSVMTTMISTASEEIVTSTKPLPILNLREEFSNDSTIHIQWTAPSNTYVKFYIVYVEGNNGTINHNISGKGNEMILTDLSMGSQYNVTVTVTTGYENSDPVFKEFYTIPAAVQSLTTSSESDVTVDNITVYWTVDQSAKFDKFQLTISPAPATTTSPITVGFTVSTATFTGLTGGSTYIISIQTQLAHQLSIPFSRTFRTKPNTPGNITASAVSGTEIAVQWSPSDGQVDSYSVTLTPVTDLNESEQSINVTGTSYSFIGLVPGHEYNIRLVAQSGEHVSEPLERSVITNEFDPMSVPEITVAELGSYQIKVTWMAPSNSSFDNYELVIDPSDTDSPVVINKGAPLSHTFERLTAGQLYSISIVTNKDGVRSERSVVREITKPRPVQNLTASAYNTTALTIRWTIDSQSLQSHFTVKYNPDLPNSFDIELPTVTAVQGQTEYNLYLDNLIPGGTFNIKVQAWQNLTGESTASDLQEVVGTTRPNPVQSLTTLIEGTIGVTVRWTKHGEGSQDHFSVWHRANLRNSNTTWIKNSTLKTNLTLMDLFPGERYEIHVYAVSRNTYSEAKIANVQTKPLAPTDLIAVPHNTTEESITLQWTYEQTETFVESWTVSYVSTSAELKRKTVPQPDVGTTVSVTLNELTAGYQYNLSVTASVSDVSSALVSVLAVTKPFINTTLSDGGSSNTSVTVDYTVEEKDYFDHFIFHLVDSNTATNDVYKSKANVSQSVTFTGLNSGNLYTVEVQTVSVDQRSVVKHIVLQTLPNIAVMTYSASSYYITLEISKPSGEIDSYNVVCTNSIGVSVKNVSLPGSEPTQIVLVENLSPHNEYTCEVTSVVKFKTNTWTQTIYTLEAAPSAVTDLSVIEKAPNQVAVSWGTPVNPNGQIKGYFISYVGTLQDREDDVGDTNVPASQYLATFSNLKAGYLYTFKVLAETVDLGEVNSATVLLKTYQPLYRPGLTLEEAQPSIVDSAVLAPKTNRFYVNFTRPFSDLSGEIIAYTVIVTTDRSTTDNQYQNRLPSWKNAKLNPTDVKTYQAVDNCSDFFMAVSTCGGQFGIQKRSADIQDFKVFQLGSDTNCASSNKTYCNGPLQPGTTYFVALRAYNTGHFKDTLFSGPIKTAKIPVPDEGGSNVGGIVAGVIVAIIVVVAVVIGILFLRRRMRQKSNMYRQQPGQHLTPKSSIRGHKSSCPIAVTDFKEHARLMSADSDFKYAEQFEDLKDVGRNQACTAAELPCNRGKNRFTNILPYDHSRVKLLPVDDEEGSDYINANYVPGYNSKREYLVTQGPLPSTRDDFWRMLWEQNTRNIVMLTKCSEKGREKCDHYWPTGSDAVFYGDLQVAILNETMFPDWQISEFRVSLGDQSRQIRHFHFTAWPDFGVPKVPQTLVRFVRTVRDKMFKDVGPIIVHCSAGVGRSGTFIVLDRLLQEVETASTVDIFKSVAELRKERVWMVQTEQQYICIHECLLCVTDNLEDVHIYDNVGHANPAFDDDEGVGLN